MLHFSLRSDYHRLRSARNIPPQKDIRSEARTCKASVAYWYREKPLEDIYCSRSETSLASHANHDDSSRCCLRQPIYMPDIRLVLHIFRVHSKGIHQDIQVHLRRRRIELSQYLNRCTSGNYCAFALDDHMDTIFRSCQSYCPPRAKSCASFVRFCRYARESATIR
jgi:hypothetical protein